MVFARQPLVELDSPSLSDPSQAVRVVGPGGDATIVAVHVANPRLRFAEWRSDHAALEGFAAGHRDGAILVVGDLNALREHEPLRRLRDLGLEDAAEQSGAGWLPTFPAQRLYDPLSGLSYPALIAIDHVLVGRGLKAASAATFRVDTTRLANHSRASGSLPCRQSGPDRPAVASVCEPQRRGNFRVVRLPSTTGGLP